MIKKNSLRLRRAYPLCKFLRVFTAGQEAKYSENYFVREYELENGLGSLHLVQKPVGDVNCVVWDAALLLAKYIEKKCSNGENMVAGKRVIELGSGLGCVGLVASLYGGNVTMTDLPEVCDLLTLNLEKNKRLIDKGKGSAEIKALNWNEDIELEPCDVLLASDCVYYKESVSGFVKTLKRLSTSSTEIYLSQENRSHSEIQSQIWREFTKEMGKFFRVKIIPPREQHEEFRTPDIYLLKLTKI